MGKRLLIAAGTAKYDHLPDDLQRACLADVVDSIDATFSKTLGYERVLQNVSINATSGELRDALDDWLSSSQRDTTDWLVLYYTGHGELSDHHLHLLTRNYMDGKLTSTSVSTEELGRMLVAAAPGNTRRRIRRCVVILDTCHSGAGTFDLLTRVHTFFEQNGEGVFAVLAATLPRQEALAGALANALIAAIQDESLGGAQQQWLTFGDIATAVAARLAPQLVLRSYSDSLSGPAEFFPNPRYVAGLPPSATVEQVRRRAVEAQDLNVVWGPSSRGIELEIADGWYFTGRMRALNELSAWLRDPSDSRTRVVTGGPGSGKSALLATVVTHSDPQARNEMPAEYRRWHAAIPENSVDVAVHAKGKTAKEVAERIASVTGVELGELSLADVLRSSGKNFTIVVDALDEAREPARIARDVLRPLSALNNVKLLVGTRPEYLENLGSRAVVIQADAPSYLERSDIAAYVKARLMRSGGEHGSTLYAGKEALAKSVGDTVAEKAFPSFLIARMVADDLLATGAVVEEQALRQGSFPESVAEAFKQYLARFGPNEDKVRDLLRPLAWAEGVGLPWSSVWPSVASRLAQRRYEDNEIRWLLQQAASFIVETTEGGVTVYRLYHQALADYFRQGEDAAHVQFEVTQALIEAVPELLSGGGRDWRLAPLYVRTHLAEHASSGGELGKLVNDPLFLLVADPAHLLPMLNKQDDEIPEPISRTYRSVLHQLHLGLPVAAGYLEMAARRNGAHGLAERITGLALGQRWTVPWAQWLPDVYSRTHARGTSDVWVLETAEWEPGVAVILIGRQNGLVEVLDTETNQILAQWQPPGVEHTAQVALATCDGEHVLVAAWDSNHLGARNLATNEEVVVALGAAEDNVVTALCVARREGRDVCITAQKDRRLAIWLLPELTLLVERVEATPAAAYALRISQEQSTDVLLMGTDTQVMGLGAFSMRRPRSTNRGCLFLLSLQDLGTIWEGAQGERGCVQHLDAAEVNGQSLVAVSQENLGNAEIWDLERRSLVWQGVQHSCAQCWFQSEGGEPLLISVSTSRDTLRIDRLRPLPGEPSAWEPIRAVPSDVPIGGSGYVRRTAIDTHWNFFSAIGHQVLSFDLARFASGASFQTRGHTSRIVARDLAQCESGSRALLAGTADGRILPFDPQTGSLLENPAFARVDNVVALGCAAAESLLVVADGEGRVHLIDTRTGDARGSFKAGDRIGALAVTRWEGRPAVLLGVGQGSVWAARLWDLESCSEIDSQFRYSLSHGEEDKRMQSIGAAEIDGSLRIAFASEYSKIMVSNFIAGAAPTRLYAFMEWNMGVGRGEAITSIAIGHDETRYWVAAGTEYGHLKIWDFRTGETLAIRENAHHHAITALRFHSLEGTPVLVSGGDDNWLMCWTVHLVRKFHIDVGVAINAIAWVDAKMLAVATERGVLAVNVRLSL
jgi:hypothetical protein